ncbi:MAG: HDIG domain-containing protein, partial [Patescibacteria group bacterium]|nr:HDIG domain-containing protein [Patescibacteria group bacterium]
MEQKIQQIKEKVKKELSCSAHNVDHIERVYNLCLLLAKDEDVDLDVLKAAALLHDIARVKEDEDSSGNTDHAVLGSEMAVPILQELDFPEEKIKHIQDCI